MTDFDRARLEGPVAYAAAQALEADRREKEKRRHKEREERIAKIVKRWTDRFEAEVHEVYLLDEDGTELEFCIEGHGANPKVIARVTKDFTGEGPAKEVISFHLRVKYTLYEHWVKHPIDEAFHQMRKRGRTYEVNFRANPIDLGRALDREWKYLDIAGWRGDRLVLP